MPVIGSGKSVYGGIYQATASGAIADGKAVIVNSDGTVSQAGPVGGGVVYHLTSDRVYMFYLENPYDTGSDEPTTSGSFLAANNASSYKDSYYSNGAAGQFQANTSNTRALNLNTDGTKLFVSDSNGASSKIQEFTFGTAYDPSTLTYVDGLTIGNKTTSPYGMTFKPDGTEAYIVSYGDSNVHQYTFSTAFDVSTGSFTRTFDTTRDDYRHGIRFKPDGTKMYIVGGNYTSDDKTDQYTLSTAWDISTASYDSVSLDHSSYITTPTDLLFNNDGTKLFVIGTAPYSRILTYTLSTAYDLSTASYTNLISPYHATYGQAWGAGGVQNKQVVGFSVGAVSDGQTASIRVVGGLGYQSVRANTEC